MRITGTDAQSHADRLAEPLQALLEDAKRNEDTALVRAVEDLLQGRSGLYYMLVRRAGEE